MRREGLSKVVLSIIYCAAVFIIALISISAIMNQGNTDMTTEMAEATFPVLTFQYDNYSVSEAHGYASPMDITHLRETITPLMDDRRIAFGLETYGEKVYHISYELRSLNDSRLIENGDIMDYIQEGNRITANVNLKDLMEPEREYSFCVIVQTEQEEAIYYYTNVFLAEGLNVADKLKFAYEFNELTFNKAEAANQLPTYLESNAQGDNSTFYHVNIHSSLDQVTWGNLAVEKATEPVAEVKSLDSSMAEIEMNYLVSIAEEKGNVYYRIKEYYRFQEGSERFYLLDYERDMEQIFDYSTGTIANNKFVLGITDDDVNMLESSDGNRLVFEQSGRLYCYNATDNKLEEIFSFYSNDLTDLRDSYNHHKIKIFQVDETGNIHFMVYGYMNRGDHQGETGIGIYYYDGAINTIEELAFVPYDSSYELLYNDVGKLAYLNSINKFYLWRDGAIYRMDINNSTVETVVSGLNYNDVITSADQTVAAWMNGQKIVTANFDNPKQSNIEPDSGDAIKPIGFFGNDLIYGIAHKSDISSRDSDDFFPMYKVMIIGAYGTVIKEYEEPGYYVVGTEFNDTMIRMERMTKTNGTFEEADGDQILYNKEAETTKNTVETAITDTYEKIVQIAVKKDINVDTLQYLTPRFVLKEGYYSADLPEVEECGDIYYAYGNGGLLGVFDQSSEAIAVAAEQNGTVLDAAGEYVYRTMSLPEKNQIMAITGAQTDGSGGNSGKLATCLDEMLSYMGASANTRSEVLQGTGAVDILQKYIDQNELQMQAISMIGCTLKSALYYVAQDIPVLVQMKDGSAYLLIGYNAYNTVVMDPVSGEVYKMGMNDSTELFEANGNQFVTYYKKN